MTTKKLFCGVCSHDNQALSLLLKYERNGTNSIKCVYHIKLLGQPDSHYILLFVQLTDFQLQKEARIWGLLLSKLNMYILDQFYFI